jgi:hypothetical protein
VNRAQYSEPIQVLSPATEFEPAFVEALQEAVTPTPGDVMIARAAVLASLEQATTPQRISDFEIAWLTDQDASRPPERTTYHASESTEPDRRLADPDRRDPHIMEIRGRHAVRQAIAELTAEGLITRGEGNVYDPQPQRFTIQYPGGGSSAPIQVFSPVIAAEKEDLRYQLLRPSAPADTLLPVEEMLEGIGDLLGSRGAQLVRESRRALQRGLYIAASSLLAAASEAAWFNLGRAVAQPDSKLAKLVDDGREAAEVIRLTEQRLRELGGPPVRVTEVVSEAHHYRDIRNYALHPTRDHETDREAWLTETGATVLAVAARRYLVKMAELMILGNVAAPQP